MKNIGKTDKWVRLIAGLGLLALAMYFQVWLAIPGLILIVTAFLNWCPVYALFRLNSCGRKRKKTTEGNHGVYGN